MSDAPLVRMRRVPSAAPVTALLVWDWRESYFVLLVFVVPGALLVHVPALVPAVFIALIMAGLAARIRSIARWWTVLRSGEVADVQGAASTSVGASTRRISHATGWRVHRGWFTGDITDNLVTYTVGGEQRSVEIRGLPYTSGVVLAHPLLPKAQCVSDLPFDLRQADDHRWTASVPEKFWPGACATAVLYGLLVAGAMISTRHWWFSA
ncbi:hypothetical protein QMK17_08970 [Rhodococcus sp. G-MC3]|uniref:hypothetical protein n=1 Tax=Rhodococcus sp. G-MC3 TaxID=3046209 RepID=UPI0024BB7196|nr:hypothetical protein [Rhodococcus sp. G-MC3]MDJ0393464.1 hypothetical protein [Rhodococcus sp. G-MC3]